MRQQQLLSHLLTNSRKKQGRSGLSLIELVVVIGMLSGIAMAMINLVSHSSAMVAKGAATMELNQKARTAVDRISPYLLSASVSPRGNSEMINSPGLKVDVPSADQLLSYKSIQFSTTEDFLNNGYVNGYDAKLPVNIEPDGTQSIGNQQWTPTFVRHNYEIYFDEETSPKTHVLENGDTIKLGQVRLRRLNPGYAGEDTSVDSVPLAHNVQLFRCHVIGLNCLEVIVHTVGKRKGPHGGMIDTFEEARGIVNTPSRSYF